MASPKPAFHFPTEIHLERKPLAEAWLELQWRTENKQLTTASMNLSDEDVDTFYPLALGAFYQHVRNNYPVQEALLTSQFPDNILPHTVRHRFRVAPNQWPVIQIGPGIATVNLIEPYTWQLFRRQAMFLRDALLSAYQGVDLRPSAIILRYRNVFPFDHRSQNTLEFLGGKLNLRIVGSPHIPGEIGEKSGPTEVGLNLGYMLSKPLAVGNIRIMTAFQTDSAGENQPIILIDLEVRGRNEETNPLLDNMLFPTWLDDAHAVIHEWFFALIDGPLRQEFEASL